VNLHFITAHSKFENDATAEIEKISASSVDICRMCQLKQTCEKIARFRVFGLSCRESSRCICRYFGSKGDLGGFGRRRHIETAQSARAFAAAEGHFLSNTQKRGKKDNRPRNHKCLQGLMLLLARATGIEPATTGSTVRYSNQLSYAPTPLGESEIILFHPWPTSPRGKSLESCRPRIEVS
jgi:hypothetical protein